ncbi:class A beta-lactamase [Microbacterium sp. LWO14-1.2]|uniref:class A beta-lactamase n=1 Tax=Microbacterium sp. LWO14-1.2 TaxID=3135263 RepID=UPI0031393DEC
MSLTDAKRTTTTWTRALAVSALAVVLAASGCSADPAPPSPVNTDQTAAPTPPAAADIGPQIRAIEAEFAVTVGVAAIRDDGRIVDHDADVRLPYASTMKVFIAAALLATASPEERGTNVRWTASQIDAAGYSPVTSEHLDDGLSLDALAEAAVRDSDNTAANLVMESLGGPAAVQDFLRARGDATTVVTAYEPELNVVVPGSDDNTSTPSALATSLKSLVDGDSLDTGSRETLLDWMSGNATGDALIRAAAPAGWAVADKSGGAGGVRNDVAVVTTGSGERIYIAILTAKTDPDAAYDDEVVEEVARVVLAEF